MQNRPSANDAVAAEELQDDEFMQRVIANYKRRPWEGDTQESGEMEVDSLIDDRSGARPAG